MDGWGCHEHCQGTSGRSRWEHPFLFFSLGRRPGSAQCRRRIWARGFSYRDSEDPSVIKKPLLEMRLLLLGKPKGHWPLDTGHWPLDTACPGGGRRRPLPANSEEVFLLWTCTGSLRRGLTACTHSHGAGGRGRGQGVSGHALACRDLFRGSEGWLVLPVVSWRPES